MEFFSRDAGTARRNALADSLDGLAYYVPPELRPWLGIANELNPVVGMERAGTNALAVADPSRSGWERVQALGDMSSNMAGAVAPIVAASRGAAPAAQAVEDALMGWSTAAGVPDFMADEFGGVGFRAYHGSPHDFDRFSLDKIGTGEGAQAYGHGLYFAENEAVAQGYRDALAPGMGDGALRAIGISDSDLRTMRQFTQSSVDPDIALRDWLGWTGKRETPELRAAFMQEWNGRNPGRMYEVQINADPNDFLDWDKPLSEQPQVLQRLGMSARPEEEIHDEALRLMTEGNAREPGKMWFDYPELQARIDELQGELDRRAPNMSGQEFYRGGADGDVSNILSQMGYGNPEVQTQALREAGIPGIRYLDAGSRGAGDGSRNYVVFDDKLIEIIRKYGWAAAAPIFAASGLTVEEAQAQYEGQM